MFKVGDEYEHIQYKWRLRILDVDIEKQTVDIGYFGPKKQHLFYKHTKGHESLLKYISIGRFRQIEHSPPPPIDTFM